MIPKATILAVADEDTLLATTVDKDYVLGWLLYGIAEHPDLSRWVFKGGTCLKKCFFETYRFSEDLDFTVPESITLSEVTINAALTELSKWVHAESGIGFPVGGLTVEEYTNKQGTTSFQARLTYTGALSLPRSQLQRVKFDITQHEILVDEGERRPVSHPYQDAKDPPPLVLCYSVDEILAEKTRALHERQGRARDVYDIVHIARSFRDQISPEKARRAVERKFQFKGLEQPTVDSILARIDRDGLTANWEQQLRHQLPVLPDVQGFLAELTDALTWWMDSTRAAPVLPAVAIGAAERAAPRVYFRQPRATLAAPGPADSLPDPIRFAARNRLLVRFTYQGAERVAEPYSLRYRTTGSLLLYAHEQSKAGRRTEQLKSFNVAQIVGVTVLDTAFTARWRVEL